MNDFVYFIGKSLYINLTNRCSNDCDFCIRNGRSGMNGSKLWLEKEPSASEVIAALPANLGEYKEVVFCGFGEPTYKLDELVEISRYLKSKGVKTRMNTNGQANLIWNRDVTDEIARSCDEVNVSLNECNAEKYDEHCRSTFGKEAFAAIIDFALLLKAKGVKVNFSVVDSIGEADVAECERLCKELAVPLRVRKKE